MISRHTDEGKINAFQKKKYSRVATWYSVLFKGTLALQFFSLSNLYIFLCIPSRTTGAGASNGATANGHTDGKPEKSGPPSVSDKCKLYLLNDQSGQN